MTKFNQFECLESRLFMSITPGGSVHEVPTGGTTVNVPAKPSGLAGTASGPVVKLTWADNSNNETGFVVQRYLPGAPIGKNLVDVGTMTANVTTFTDTKAPAGTDYYVVRSFNTAGRSEGSNGISVSVHADTVVTVVAPNQLRTAAAGSTKITVSWAGDLGASGGYIIQRATSSIGPWTAVGTVGTGVRTFTDSGLTAKTKYAYRIVALGAGGTSATSNAVVGMTASGDSTTK